MPRLPEVTLTIGLSRFGVKLSLLASVESVNSSFQQNTIYGLMILREAGKQLALIAETVSSQNNRELKHQDAVMRRWRSFRKFLFK